jgi:Uma2 family endonuclease
VADDKPRPHRFSADDYHRMEESGILGDDARVELVDGEIVDAPSAGGGHGAAVARIGEVLRRAVGDRATVRIGQPVALGGASEPEADVCVVRDRAVGYAEHPPRPDDVLLVVEVADTSVGFDNDVKAPLYAKAGVIENWIVDTSTGVVLVARDPQPCGYMDTRRAGAGEAVAPLMLPGAAVAVSDIV